MKLEIFFVVMLFILVVYEGYLKGPIKIVYSYAKIIGGILLCCYLFYNYNKSPKDFVSALELTKGFFLKSDNFMSAKLSRTSTNATYEVRETRKVSQLLKKQVASKQKWTCGHCKNILDASYEVDHIIALYKGGSNSENNLIALCRNCHGKKTVAERLK
jgi:hypothetical protein